MHKHVYFLILFWAGQLAFSYAQTAASEASALPLLEADFVLGTTFYGSASIPERTSPEYLLLKKAMDRGLAGFTYYVDWADLEPEADVYTLEGFTRTLDDLQRLGLAPFVNITVGDSGGYNLPDDLIASGLALDASSVTERFGKLLDRLVPILSKRGGFYLGVGNEVGEYLDINVAERDAYVQFVHAARLRVQQTNPQLAVGVTLTPGDVRFGSKTFQALKEVVDVIPFNYSPIKPDFHVLPVAAIAEDFREVVAAYGEGVILIQELTCPSANTMSASERWQRDCFAQLFEEIRQMPVVRFASVFTYQDFDAETCVTIRDAIFEQELDDLPDAVAQRLTDYLCYLGIVRPDGEPKPAYRIMLRELELHGTVSPD